jgi:hypothetical protein
MVYDPMSRKEITTIIRNITRRAIPEGGGFSEHPDAPYRADATAWAILALKAYDTKSDIQDSAKSKLASMQFDDGRICLSQSHPEVIWPTALAIFALKGSAAYRKQSDLAIQFLLQTKGTFFKKNENPIFALDSSLIGWPWIEDTFSWVEPTGLSTIALNAYGYSKHDRIHEAIHLLIDRQLPSGGWNIGSTIIYGRETYPQLDCTGIALSALAGQVERGQIERSLNYLKTKAALCRTPLSLGWALFGLGAWGERPTDAKKWIIESLSRQRKYGTYGTTLLSLLVLAYSSNGGFLETIT